MSHLVQQLQQTYNDHPYQSFCFRQSSPEHLATIAHLFGLQSPGLASARVLELGCASAGNLIPFAARHPQARAVGIDLSSVQVEEGQRRAAQLGLENIELRQADLSTLDSAELGTFDYIICHGVYSWVPEHVRQAILRICKDNLAADGIAYVSYNTYPGWKGREIVRDAMLLRAQLCTGPAVEKLAYARGMVNFLQQWASPQGVLGTAVAECAPIVRDQSDDYLIHDYLEPCNAPCYFADFVGLAQSQGLSYLAEAEPPSMFISNYASDMQAPLLNECGHSQVMLEQYLDFLSNRSFRQTLLVHAERADAVQYQISHERLRGLSMAARLLCEAGEVDLTTGEQRFLAPDGRALVLRSPVVKVAAAQLTRAWPRTLDVDALLVSVRAELGVLADDAEQHILELFEHLVLKGMGRYCLSPVAGLSGTQGKPKADPKAIAYGELETQGQRRHTYNPWHEPVMLDAVALFLLPKLDGQHSRQQLLDAMAVEVEEGRLRFFRNGQPIIEQDELQDVMPQHLERVLEMLVA